MIEKIKSNWKSGLTVALIAVPLSISLAVASRISPLQGIITGVWAGLIASLFGGSNFNIVGPTGALSGIIASFVLTQGAESVSTLAIVTGFIILCAYVLHFERYLVFIPSSVIHGFTLGVALIIGLNQLNFAFGLQDLPVHHEFLSNVWESVKHLQKSSLAAFLVFITFLSALFIIKKLFKAVPGVVVLSPLGIVFGYLTTSFLNLETLGSRYGDINVKLFQLPSLTFSSNLFSTAFIVALVAILETMLSAKIADNLTKTKHSDSKELFGLALANLASGCAGGMPATAALARTVVNIKSGANDRASAMLSSILMFFIALLCLVYFKFMPMAVVAAILVSVAINMVETDDLVRLFTHNKFNFAVAIFVAGVTLYRDPMVGILGGAAISLLFFIKDLSQGYHELAVKYRKTVKEPLSFKQLTHIAKDAGVLIYTFKGKLSYMNSQAHVVRFESDLQHYGTIILNLREVYFIDIDGIDALDEIIEVAHKKHKEIYVTGVNPLIESLLKSASKQFQSLESKHMVFETTSQALSHVGIQPE
jgi:SulP family sulfate permease